MTTKLDDVVFSMKKTRMHTVAKPARQFTHAMQIFSYSQIADTINF